MHSAWKFAEFDFFFDLYRPLSPIGKTARENTGLFTSSQLLEKEYDRIEMFLSFLSAKEVAVRQIENRLKRIPRLETEHKRAKTSADIFAVKKFLANAGAVFSLLPQQIKRELGMEWKCAQLLETLGKGGDEETFYLSDRYSAGLAGARAKIKSADISVQKIKKHLNAELRAETGLDFSGKSFAVVDRRTALKLASRKDLFIEPHDSDNMVVKPVYGEEYISLSSEKERLLALEQKEEAIVIETLSRAIAAKSRDIEAHMKSVEQVDLLLAKARMAHELKLTRPCFRSGGIKVKSGVLLPLEKQLRSAAMEYTPLDCAISDRITVVHGSNMGGKTVVLKTLAFLQLAAQSGFFVPARKFETQVFDSIGYVGDGAQEQMKGLSSFGMEIYSFNSAYGCGLGKRLMLIDEFARTTNSREARALLSAMTEVFSRNRSVNAVIATHFAGLPSKKGISFMRMKGFDGKAFEKRAAAAGVDFAARLAVINRCMRYELVRDDDKIKVYDAVKVAKILGLDADIISAAQKIMEAGNEE